MTAPDTSAPAPAPARSGGRTRGLIAIAAGTALLIGGTGTYAYWSTSQAISADDIVTGDLDLALGTGTWTLDGVLGAPVAVTDLEAIRIVPGDVLTLDQSIDVLLEGDTIEADLSVDLTGVIPAGQEAYFSVAFDADGIGTSTGPNTWRLTPADAGEGLETTVTLTFNGPATTGTIAQGLTLDLTALEITLVQAED